MKSMIAATVATLSMGAAWLPALAQAQSSDTWKFDAVLYGYFPAIGGKTNFPIDTGVSVSIDPDKYLGSLNGAFLGSFQARKGDWGAFTDILYLSVGGSKSDTRQLTIGGVQVPATASANVHVDLKTLAWTLAGTFRAVNTPDAALDVFAGARLLEAKQTINLTLSGDIGPIPLPGRTAHSEINPSYWDGVVGAKGRFAFGDERKWFVPYYVDVGTGQSQLTWQAMGGLGYSFQWGDIFGAWRYLDYKMKSGEKIDSLNLNGPMLAVAFHW